MNYIAASLICILGTVCVAVVLAGTCQENKERGACCTTGHIWCAPTYYNVAGSPGLKCRCDTGCGSECCSDFSTFCALMRKKMLEHEIEIQRLYWDEAERELREKELEDSKSKIVRLLELLAGDNE